MPGGHVWASWRQSSVAPGSSERRDHMGWEVLESLTVTGDSALCHVSWFLMWWHTEPKLLRPAWARLPSPSALIVSLFSFWNLPSPFLPQLCACWSSDELSSFKPSQGWQFFLLASSEAPCCHIIWGGSSSLGSPHVITLFHSLHCTCDDLIIFSVGFSGLLTGCFIVPIFRT